MLSTSIAKERNKTNGVGPILILIAPATRKKTLFLCILFFLIRYIQHRTKGATNSAKTLRHEKSPKLKGSFFYYLVRKTKIKRKLRHPILFLSKKNYHIRNYGMRRVLDRFSVNESLNRHGMLQTCMHSRSMNLINVNFAM